jgi:hypothetical protein
MELFTSILKSLRIQNLKVAFYMWIFNFFIGASIFYFIYQFIAAYTHKSLIPSRSGFQEYLEFLTDIFHINDSSLTIFLTFTFMVFMLFILISIFISAGVYSVFVNDEKATFKNLFSFSFTNFFKILKIFVINMVSFSLAIFSSAILFYLFLHLQNRSVHTTMVQIFFYIVILCTFFIMIFVCAVYDFSRILKLKFDQNIIFCYKRGMAIVWSKRFSLVILFFIFLLLTGILHALLSTTLTQFDDKFPVYIIFIFYQIFFFMKYCLKAILMSTEVNFIDDSKKSK